MQKLLVPEQGLDRFFSACRLLPSNRVPLCRLLQRKCFTASLPCRGRLAAGPLPCPGALLHSRVAQRLECVRLQHLLEERKNILLLAQKVRARGTDSGLEQPPAFSKVAGPLRLFESGVDLLMILVQTVDATFVLQRMIESRKSEVLLDIGMTVKRPLDQRGEQFDFSQCSERRQQIFDLVKEIGENAVLDVQSLCDDHI